jgi:hypothetical protein
LHVTERFRRRDFGHLELRVTFEDSKITEPGRSRWMWC